MTGQTLSVSIEIAILALVLTFGLLGIGFIAALVIVIWHRQERLLSRIAELLLVVEQETRATSHAVGAEEDVTAASARWKE